jgi:SAM-dependent methyltransferase
MQIHDNPSPHVEIRKIIEKKPVLRRFYERAYRGYAECLKSCPNVGLVLELGSGAGFANEVIPELITSDILPYKGVDKVIDATDLPFPDRSLRLICMMNVLHHLSEVEMFFREAQRCLVKGGRIFIVDQHLGWISLPILKYLHHEPFDISAKEWKSISKNPLAGANGALPWLIFIRDRSRFESLFPQLRLVRYAPHTPLAYWLAGGLKSWSLVPGWACNFVAAADQFLLNLSNECCSFVDIELVHV